MNESTMLGRNGLGRRFFTKADGKVYQTVATGVLNANGDMTYRDQLVSESSIDACAALTATEYKMVDEVVNDERENPDRFSVWLRGLGNNIVKSFDGMKTKCYFYNRKTGQTVSRSTMDLEDDAPNTTFQTEEDGVCLPLEFGDWQSNIREDPSASSASGIDVAAEKASACANGVATGLDLRQINGWGGLTYRSLPVYGFRDVPATLTVAQAGTVGGGGWLASDVTTTQIYNDIVSMVRLMNNAKLYGPYVLLVPESFRLRLAETYSTSVNGDEKSLWAKLLEKPGADIPNVLDIMAIKTVKELDETKGGGTPTAGEAYLLPLNPRHFRVLNYLPMTSFTIDLKGGIATKHRVVEGLCPLFKKDSDGVYGIAKLAVPTS